MQHLAISKKRLGGKSEATVKRHVYATNGGKSPSASLVPSFLQRGSTASVELANFNGFRAARAEHAVALPTVSLLQSLEGRSQNYRPETSASSSSDQIWNQKTHKLQGQTNAVIRQRKHQHRLKSLTIGPPVVREVSLVPDDMRLSETLPPPFPTPGAQNAEILQLESWLEKTETRIRRRKLSKRPEKLLSEAQLLYSSCFAEITRQVQVENSGRKTAALLRRVWQLYQILFDQLAELHEKAEKSSEEAAARFQKRIQYLEQHGTKANPMRKIVENIPR